MEVGEQIVDLLLVKHLTVGGHLVAAETDNVGHTIIVSGHAALGKVLPFENAFHAGPLASTGGIGSVTAVAIVVVDAAAGGLLGSEAEFGVALAALDVAAGKDCEESGKDQNRFQIED